MGYFSHSAGTAHGAPPREQERGYEVRDGQKEGAPEAVEVHFDGLVDRAHRGPHVEPAGGPQERRVGHALAHGGANAQVRGGGGGQSPRGGGGTPPLPFQCLRLTAKILLRRLRCQEDLRLKFCWPAFAWDHRGGPGRRGVPAKTPSPPPSAPLSKLPCLTLITSPLPQSLAPTFSRPLSCPIVCGQAGDLRSQPQPTRS